MNVFVDTEFSSLGSDPRLISIAFLAESGESLYIEFTSGWDVTHCSKWVIEHVLPQLGNGEPMDRTAAARRIVGWLSRIAQFPVLISDSTWDADLIAHLFAEAGFEANTYRVEVVQFLKQAEAYGFETARQRFFTETGRCQHHALTDADALRFAWLVLQRDRSTAE